MPNCRVNSALGPEPALRAAAAGTAATKHRAHTAAMLRRTAVQWKLKLLLMRPHRACNFGSVSIAASVLQRALFALAYRRRSCLAAGRSI